MEENMERFEAFTANKQELLKKLENSKNKFLKLQEIGIDCSDALSKIQQTVKNVEDDKISIVLVGSFSDGKTSVASGWLGQKLAKIDLDESSDAILFYSPENMAENCRIVDTPGLFGEKEEQGKDGKIIKLSDKTKKYIDEANIILYVVEAKNPIKDSHKESIRWILKDLQKLENTIFVINKMDDVADLTDDDDFIAKSEIKKENLRLKIKECADLSDEQLNDLNIVCISAIPDGKDFDFWLQHKDIYEKRSRIASLENLTQKVLEKDAGTLVTQTGCVVLNNALSQLIKTVDKTEQHIERDVLPEMKESIKRNEKELDRLRKQLFQQRIDMLGELKVLEKKKVNAIRSSSIENFQSVMEDEIGIVQGREFAVLEQDVDDILMKYAEKAFEKVKIVRDKFIAEYEKRDELLDAVGKQAVTFVSEGLSKVGVLGVDTIKGAIFIGRELLGKIGIVIKFKPWQVTKIATAASGALPIIGAAIDIVSNVVGNAMTQASNRKFEESKKDIIKNIHTVFTEVQNTLRDDEKYLEQFAPEYKILVQQLKKDRDTENRQKELIRKFREWKKDAVDANFKII